MRVIITSRPHINPKFICQKTIDLIHVGITCQPYPCPSEWLNGRDWLCIRAQHFLRICTHTQTTLISNDLCSPMPTHSMICAHPCYSNCAHVCKNCNITITITNNIAPMPTQNPWAWVGIGMGTQCRAMLYIPQPTDRGEPAVSYKWNGWVWEITGLSSRLQDNYQAFKRIYGIYPNSIKENRRMSTWNRLDLQTLGSQLIMPKNLLEHWLDLNQHINHIPLNIYLIGQGIGNRCNHFRAMLNIRVTNAFW